MLRETEPKGTFPHRRPGVGRVVQVHDYPTLLHGVYIDSMAKERK